MKFLFKNGAYAVKVIAYFFILFFANQSFSMEGYQNDKIKEEERLSLLPPEIVSTILKRLIPKSIENEDQLISALHSITNFITSNRLNYSFAEDTYTLKLIEKALKKSIESSYLVSTTLKTIKEKKLNILKSLQNILSKINNKMKSLERAIEANNHEELEKLLKDGYNPNLVISDGFTLLETAVISSDSLFHTNTNLTLIKLLLEYGANINKVTLVPETLERSVVISKEKTSLYIALIYFDLNAAIYLLKNGANPLIALKEKYQIYAVNAYEQKNHKKIGKLIKLLVRNGIDANYEIIYKKPMLVYAIKINNVNLAEFLLKHNADPNIIFSEREQLTTALEYAKQQGNKEMVELLERYSN